MKIVVKKGLDIPIKGKPAGPLRTLEKPSHIALNLDPFGTTRFKVHVQAGGRVHIGQPLVESKSLPGQMFVSPASGTVCEIRRGEKRRLINIVIEVDAEEDYVQHGTVSARASREEILDLFLQSGIFPHIRMRPFDLIADPRPIPRAIFVQAVESLPSLPPAEMQVEGHEIDFQAGLDVLQRLTDGKVHLVYHEHSSCSAFREAEGVEKHTVVGPHPAGSSSVHIHHIDPVRHSEDYVWTLSTLGVLTVGRMARTGQYHTDRVVSLAGEGILEGERGFFSVRSGFPIQALAQGRTTQDSPRLISGDPLTGTCVDHRDFLGFYHTALTVIPENTQRQLFHFLRLGADKFTATKGYVTGHVKPPEEGYPFTTNQHGEERAFIDAAVYERVMPMRIPTMHLIKAILAEDFELAEQLGLLEVTGEDFALPTFICPSKIEMMRIVQEGLHRYAKEMGH